MSRWAYLYNSKAWRARRAAQLRDFPLCRYCELVGAITPATVADHVVPHRGDDDLFFHGPLQSLCATCHNSAKAELERTGRLKGSLPDGTPLDPNHHWHTESSVSSPQHPGGGDKLVEGSI